MKKQISGRYLSSKDQRKILGGVVGGGGSACIGEGPVIATKTCDNESVVCCRGINGGQTSTGVECQSMPPWEVTIIVNCPSS